MPWDGGTQTIGDWVVNHDVIVAHDRHDPRITAIDPQAEWDRFDPYFAWPQAWIRHPVTGVVHLWVQPDEAVLNAWSRASWGEDLTPQAELREVLERTGLLVRADRLARRRKAWMRSLADARAALADQGACVLPGVFAPTPEFIASLRPYLDRRDLLQPDIQEYVPHRFAHADVSYCRFLHRQFDPAVASVLPDKVRPSYPFLARYDAGASMLRHTDRPQCRWNASILLDSDPAIVDPARGWAIHVATAHGDLALRASLGDAVIFSGTKCPHWRRTMPGHIRHQTIMFCHWVSADFAGPLA